MALQRNRLHSLGPFALLARFAAERPLVSRALQMGR